VCASNISSCTDRHDGLPAADFAPIFSSPMAYGSLETGRRRVHGHLAGAGTK
jgi:hypothetical protein